MLRKNSKARSWVGKKVKQLEREGTGYKQALAIALSEGRKYGLLKNSGEVEELRDELDDAQEVARGFHGRENEEEIEEVDEEQYRSELALLGELVELEVFNETQEDMLIFDFGRDNPDSLVNLACSGDRKQLFLVGGDQSIEDETLEQLGAGWDKDKVRVGYVYSISYFADKHHLTGPKQQKFGTEYIHSFGEQTVKAPVRNEGVWKLEEKLERNLLPELIYDRLNCKIELVGGGYEIRDEGIWD